MSEHPASSSVLAVPPKTFATHNLAFAAFLIAGKRLPYVGTRVENGRAIFIFQDPSGEGPKLEGLFLAGAECAATTFHSTVRWLRREIDNAAGEGVR